MRPAFPETNYLPAPCSHVKEEQRRTKFEELLMDVQWIYGCDECEIERAYLDCPPSPPKPQ